jgi:siroheme synthase (precorrin-2 oxidase/ferrochelatase)
VQIGDILLTRAAYDGKRSTLLDHATSDATSQWEQLSSDPTKEAKFSLPNITTSITDDNSISKAMLKERTTEKALEEQFWNKIAEFETENEAGFSAFWTEKAALRITIYNDGLSSVEDQKLKDQLTELFAQYVQKELIPDVLSKARSRGHVLSRKSRKNIQRLESALQADGLDVPAILNSIDKFSKKQSIPPADAPVLEAAKQTMMSDMVRRMQKQKKSDGPLLFLTLVVLLLARHSNGIVYATGKFAPKLLKQLKSGLDPEQYAALEKWKDAAKTGSLNAEDREEMKKMAEV